MQGAASRAVTGIVGGGLLAGVLDIVYAFALAGFGAESALRVLQSVASGLLGAQAFKSGWAGGLLGLTAHLAICVVAALVFYLAASRLAWVRRHYLVSGAIFGIGVYLAMNFIIVPLSAAPFKITYTPLRIAQGFISHALLVGLPIAWWLHRCTSAAEPQPPESPGR